MHDMELQQTPGGSESSILSWYSSFTVTTSMSALTTSMSALTANPTKKSELVSRFSKSVDPQTPKGRETLKFAIAV